MIRNNLIRIGYYETVVILSQKEHNLAAQMDTKDVFSSNIILKNFGGKNHKPILTHLPKN
jgi:hypothetical protein